MDRHGDCVLCTNNMVCIGTGVTTATIGIKPGTWRAGNTSIVILSCPVRDTCVGSVGKLNVGSGGSGDLRATTTTTTPADGSNGISNGIKGVNGTQISSNSNSTYSDSLCAEGHTGVLCATCKAGWHKGASAGTSMCAPCPRDVSESIALTTALIVGGVGVVAMCVLLDLRFGFSKSKGGGRLKPLLNGVQLMSVLLMFPAKWPDAVKELSRLLDGVRCVLLNNSVYIQSIFSLYSDYIQTMFRLYSDYIQTIFSVKVSRSH